MEQTPYQRAAVGYAAAGFSPIPMTGPTPGTPKGVPFGGVTGHEGMIMTPTRVNLFLTSDQVQGYPNIALRAVDWIGIDVDAYEGREGAQTLADLEAKLGALPPTMVSSARPLPSGIRIYRLPEGVDITAAAEAMVRTVGQGVDIIRFAHRYVKCWPTVHPSGAQYRWWTSYGEQMGEDFIPHLASLPTLPEAWIEFFTSEPPAPARPGNRERSGPANGSDRIFSEEQAQAFVAPFLAAVRNTPWGTGQNFNAVLNDAAYTLRGFLGFWSEETIWDMISAAVREGHATDLDGNDNATIKSGLYSPADWSARRPDERDFNSPFSRYYTGPLEQWPTITRNGKTVDMAPPQPNPGDEAAPVPTFICDEAGRVEGDPTNEIFDRTPFLRWVRHLARSTETDPLAVLGQCYGRAVAGVPPYVVLPAIIGAEVSANLMIAFVGKSGDGKGAATGAAKDNYVVTPYRDNCDKDGETDRERKLVHENGLGTGQGFVAVYVEREEKDMGGGLVRRRHAAIFDVAEVDDLNAHAKAASSTILSTVRSVWMGERLGNSYKNRMLDLHVPAQSYRAIVFIGVQPERAGVLLDDAAGGTPQRILWLPTLDLDFGPENFILRPGREGINLDHQSWGDRDPYTGTIPIKVCDSAVQAIRGARKARRREMRALALGLLSDGEEDRLRLDSHALLTREKVAYANAVCHGRWLEISEEDWEISGQVMEFSDRTREKVARALRKQEAVKNVQAAKARGHAKIVEDQIVGEATDTKLRERATRAVLAKLTRAGAEGVTKAELRRHLAADLRYLMDEHEGAVLDILLADGKIKFENIMRDGEQVGSRWFLNDGTTSVPGASETP